MHQLLIKYNIYVQTYLVKSCYIWVICITKVTNSKSDLQTHSRSL